MNQKKQRNPSLRFTLVATIAAMALAMLAAALPQPVRAAVTCQAYYTVRAGDTTPRIAHTYGLKWREIAAANGMKITDRLTVEQQLCIPAPEEKATTGKKVTVPATDKKANIVVSIAAKRISLGLSKFTQEHTYLVKVRDASVGIGGWYKLRTVVVDEDTDTSLRITVPDELQRVLYLQVCLKDQGSDELICRVAINP